MTKNPYNRLLEVFKDYARKVEYRRKKLMWRYPVDKLDTGWSLVKLNERVLAAQQIGYEVILAADEQGLFVYYQKKAPDMPYEVR